MQTPSDPSSDWDILRAKIIGLGERSIRKSYYPELEQRLMELERFRALLDQSNDLIFLVNIPSGRFIDVNESACRQLICPRNTLLTMSIGDIIPSPVQEELNVLFSDETCDGQSNNTLITTFTYQNNEVPVEMSVRRVVFSDDVYAVIVARNIAARKQLEAENKQLAAQFFQMQKMESIGRLAGGVAHDFNNLLVPIIGYTELSMLQLTPENRLYNNLMQIKKAAERAANLSRQILVFSRQQVLETRLLDLNQVIREFEPMLRRLIGEDIDLQMCLAPTLPLIKADQGQLEQVLLNLVVNARDAMLNGGVIVIETEQVTLDETYAPTYHRIQPGEYLLLAVNDTGHGMDAATQHRIFEPFFTTKSPGKGTGLGLATVFGIIKQHAGDIWVYSEPNRGTTFKIYLPLTEGSAVTASTSHIQPASLNGNETVLLVEDELDARQLVADALRSYGYHVLEAGLPEEALTLATTYKGPLHLLLTDVVMPQMNGKKLYEQMAIERIGLKVLFMSGYTDNVIMYHGISDKGATFLQKPFTIHNLLKRIRTVLEDPSLPVFDNE